MYKNFEHQVNGGGLLGTGKHPICSHHEETGSPAPLGPVQPTKTGKKKKKKKKSKGSTRLQPTVSEKSLSDEESGARAIGDEELAELYLPLHGMSSPEVS
jgi:hypothetical protein